MTISSVTELRDRLEHLGINLSADDEQGVLDFTNRLLHEGQLLTNALGPQYAVTPQFRVEDPIGYVDAPQHEGASE